MNIQNLPDPAVIEAVLGLDGRGRRRLWAKRVLWLVLAALMTAALAWWGLASGRQAAAISYETQPVKRADITVAVTAAGKIMPTTQVDVSSEMSGVVRKVNVDNNSLVKQGDVLAELDTERLTAQWNRAKATLTAAEARIADARATMRERDVALSRAQTLRNKGISAVQDLDTARAAHDRAKAAIDAAEADAAVAKANLALTQTDIAKSRILSPVDGIVLKRTVEPGQTVASSLQAPVLFTLAGDLKRMQVEADVDEADIGAVKTGQRASFTVDAYPGRKFPAIIETIEYAPNVKDNVVTYKAVLSVDNTELLLRPGMTATAEIVVQEVANALTIANAALRYKPPAPQQQPESFSLTRLFLPRMPRFEASKNEKASGPERKIWVLENGAPRETTITVGASDGDITEIVSGEIPEGAQAVTASKQASR
jgi:HlyD family secretion protein